MKGKVMFGWCGDVQREKGNWKGGREYGNWRKKRGRERRVGIFGLDGGMGWVREMGDIKGNSVSITFLKVSFLA